MAYEYSSEQAQLDFPNPYRIENILWSLRAGILLVCAVALMLLARRHLATQSMGSFVVPVVLGAGLFVLAAWNFVRIGQQLRVFFGRGQPAGLAAELQPDQTGSTDAARAVMQTVRQGALEFAIPAGALNGVLYSLVKNLITAPVYIQNVLQNRFSNLASYTFLMATMLVALLFTWDSPVQGWVGVFFLLLVVFMAIRPVSGQNSQAMVRFNLMQVLALTLVAILGPVVLGFAQSALPDLSWASFGTQALLILLVLVVIEGVFFIAVQRHIDLPPPVSKVDTQDSISFNSDPNLLMQELDREMQRNWVHRIPNRRYARVLPDIALDQGTGKFKAQLMEESQPLAPRAFSKMDWSVVQAYPRFFWLMLIDVLGVVLTLMGALALVVFALRFNAFQDWRPVLGFATLGLSLVAVGGYAFRSAHTLWGRFDFESTLTWVEMEGSYIRSKVDIGNRLQDRVFTARDVVNVESMTLRVWVMDLRSVVFGHQSHGSVTRRIVTGMVSRPDEAQYLKNLVRQFASEQSIVVAPRAAEDAQRMASLGALNQLGAASQSQGALPAGTLAGAVLQGMDAMAGVPGDSAGVDGAELVVAAAVPAVQQKRQGRHCRSCGAAHLPGDAFCENCGSPLASV